MREQITAAVGLLLCLVKNSRNIQRERLDHFKDQLFEHLLHKYKDHWYPENPVKGNGYRCIRIGNGNKHDEVLLQSARASGIDYEDLISRLPPELTIWIDPNEVCYRLCEKSGPIFTLVSFRNNEIVE